MRLRLKHCIAISILGLVVQIPPALGQQTPAPPTRNSRRWSSLLRLSANRSLQITQYGVFDFIHFAIKGDTVILRGQASRPSLKSSLESSIKRITGVKSCAERN